MSLKPSRLHIIKLPQETKKKDLATYYNMKDIVLSETSKTQNRETPIQCSSAHPKSQHLGG